MAGVANFDAIVFFHQNKRQIRVYYASHNDNTIRESCYHQDYGWFVQADGVVTTNAKSNSPITVPRWTDTSGITQVNL